MTEILNGSALNDDPAHLRTQITLLESELFQKDKMIQDLEKSQKRLLNIINALQMVILVRSAHHFLYVSEQYATFFMQEPGVILSNMGLHYSRIINEDARVLHEWNKNDLVIQRESVRFGIKGDIHSFVYKSYPVKDQSGSVMQRIETYERIEHNCAETELLPLCSHCKKVRVNETTWIDIEEFLRQRVKTEVSHSICPMCLEHYYGNIL